MRLSQPGCVKGRGVTLHLDITARRTMHTTKLRKVGGLISSLKEVPRVAAF
jgi:hypothetical protein